MTGPSARERPVPLQQGMLQLRNRPVRRIPAAHQGEARKPDQALHRFQPRGNTRPRTCARCKMREIYNLSQRFVMMLTFATQVSNRVSTAAFVSLTCPRKSTAESHSVRFEHGLGSKRNRGRNTYLLGSAFHARSISSTYTLLVPFRKLSAVSCDRAGAVEEIERLAIRAEVKAGAAALSAALACG